MSIIYVNDGPLEIKDDGDTLAGVLAGAGVPEGNVITLDTEASGLYVDGMWASDPAKCQPKARVSAVSLAWRNVDNCNCHETGAPCNCPGEVTSLALPFDQGKIGGKEGRWLEDEVRFEILPHTMPCGHYADSQPMKMPCVCAPWNLSADDWGVLCAWLMDKRIVFHNAKYDLQIMNAGLRLHPGSGINLEPNFIWDTCTVQGIVEPTESNALDAVGRRLFHEGKTDGLAEALRKAGTGLTKRYDLVSWEVAGPYATQDAVLTCKLFYHQQERIEAGVIDTIDALKIIPKEHDLTRTLFYMELRGMPFDAEGMRLEADKMEIEVEKAKEELPFSPPTITAAKKWFFETNEIMPIKVGNVCSKCTFNKETGKRRSNTKREPCVGEHQWAPSLDAEVVAVLVGMGAPGADQWQKIADLESALHKWYRAWPMRVGEDGRLRANFRQGKTESDRKDQRSGGAISGRLSAERIQAQGVPREYTLPKGIKGVKKFFVPKDGYQLWELDVSNAEIRVAAWLSQSPSLTAKVNSGANIHDENTKAIFGIEPDHPEWEMKRTLCKIGVFSDMYGSGERTMLAQFEQGLKQKFSVKIVRDFKESLANAYPELKRTSRACQRKADVSMGGCGYVRLVNGRRRVFGWGERTHKAFNACMQGGVAELVKDWMLATDKKYPGILVNQVHDSMWLEISDDDAESIVPDIQHIGVELFEAAFQTDHYKIKFVIDAKRLG